VTLDPYAIADKAVEAAMAVVIWVGKRHIDNDREVARAHADRLHALEIERVKPDELVRVETRLQEVSDQMAANHTEILQTILNVRL
jgi:hypothetical protein